MILKNSPNAVNVRDTSSEVPWNLLLCNVNNG